MVDDIKKDSRIDLDEDIETSSSGADELDEFDVEDISADGLELQPDLDGTELGGFDAASIEEFEEILPERLDAILESIFFATDRSLGMGALRVLFKGTNIKTEEIKAGLDRLKENLQSSSRGIQLEETVGGYQLRTKPESLKFIARSLKVRPFKLSGPAMEVLAVVAYKQPVIKSEIDQIRGVESGHLLRALMEKNLVTFEGKSDLPGKPMLYSTTKKFLEVFSLRNLKELPTLAQIEELIPEGLTPEESEKTTLSQVSEQMANQKSNDAQISSYSIGEEELSEISDQLQVINTSSEFFEKEKENMRLKKIEDRAKDIREALMLGEEVSDRDRNWLIKHDESLMAGPKSDPESKKAPEDIGL